MAIFTLPIARVGDDNFRVGSGYKLYFYEAGTLTAKDTYTDNTFATPLANPVVADGNGRFPVIWTSGDYKVILKTDEDVTVWTVDNYNNDADNAKFAQGVLSAAGSAANVITANLPTSPGTLTDQLQVVVELQHGANTIGNPTFNLNSLGAKTIKRDNNQPLQYGDTYGSGGKIYLSYSASNDVWMLLNPKNLGGQLSLKYYDGLEVSNNSTDSNHDIDIATGFIADSTKSYIMNLTSAFTKQIDATFAVGDDAGGLSDQDNSGAVQADTFYGVFLISKSTDPTDCDVIMATTQANALADTVAVAAGFDIARLIYVVRTGAASNIINWVDGGNNWKLWKDSQRVVTTSVENAGVAIATDVPPFMIGRFSYLVEAAESSGGGVTEVSGFGLLQATEQDNIIPSYDNFSVGAHVQVATSGVATLASTGTCVQDVKVNGSSQIRHRETSDIAIMRLNNTGWQMDYTVTDLV